MTEIDLINELLKQNNELKTIVKNQVKEIKWLNKTNENLNHSNAKLTNDKLNLIRIIKELKKD